MSISNQGYRVFDFRFMNPFEKDLAQYGTTLGARYGYAQYILLFCLVVAVLTLTIIGRSPIVAVMYTLMWIFVYYHVSCLLIPEGSERCFLITWFQIIFPWIFFTIGLIISIFMLSSLYKMLKKASKNKSVNIQIKQEKKTKDDEEDEEEDDEKDDEKKGGKIETEEEIKRLDDLFMGGKTITNLDKFLFGESK